MTRSRLAMNPPQGELILIGDSSLRGEFAWRSLPGHVRNRTEVVDGSIEALADAGFHVVGDDPVRASSAIDRTSFADGRHDGNLEASRLYLHWEKGLTSKLDSEERAQFGSIRP